MNDSGSSPAAGKPLVLGLAGFGTVGTGLVRALAANASGIFARTGRSIQVKSVLVRDTAKARPALPKGVMLTDDPAKLVDDPEIDVLVELMGGVEAPRILIEKALAAGKHVVTANKALLAETGNQLFALAREKNLHLAYEAAVCGGIPIVQTLREGLAVNELRSLVGILNGTSNYILSEMTARQTDFASALANAQALGYAEADPALDIEGVDAAHKLALLIRLAWGVEYPFADLPVQGVSQVTPQDIGYAREFGYRVKLLGYARLVGESLATGGIEAGVRPVLVPESFLLASVDGAYNAVRIEGNAAGSVFLHGKGAGDLPTGSAVAADILAIARGAQPNNTGFVHLPPKARIIPHLESHSHYYIRLQVVDAPGVLRDVAAIMAANDISIAQVIQKEGNGARPQSHDADRKEPGVPFIVMTHEAPTKGVHAALRILEKLPVVLEPPVHYRVLAKR